MNLLFRLLACTLLAGTVSSALGQAMADPTRPALAAESGPGMAGSEAPAASGLQTIIRRAGAKPAAVINGEYVVLGGRVGDARLVKVGDDSVILRGPTGTEELRLIPGVEKKAAVPAKPKKAKATPASSKDEATK